MSGIVDRNLWDDPFEFISFSDLTFPATLFEGEDPILDANGAGWSWSSMQEWADASFRPKPLESLDPEDIEKEAAAADGHRFCCFGMLADVSIKLVGDMLALQSKIDASLIHQIFNISRHIEYFMLKFSDGGLFAQVNELASQGLAQLNDITSVELVAFVETERLQRVFARAKKPSEATLKVQVNFYGSVDDAAAVGQKLGAAKLFLQDPEHGAETFDYCNPHVAKFPGIEEPTPTSILPALSAGDSKPPRPTREGQEDYDQAISAIYHSLIRHQETALFFMMQREGGPIPPEFCLWEPERNIATPIHRLTGAESVEQPSELGGGILADDMGMGKSLSTLALITVTLEDAHLWSQELTQNCRKVRSRATLVIVPSTLIMNSWLTEIERHLSKSVIVGKYYGKDRNSRVEDYLDYDIVFTTYHTLAASMNKPHSIIFGMRWFRIVLDEAHMIRRRETTLHQAANQLSAHYRWCLTGTPIQNHLADLGSLLAFLGISQLENKAVFRNHMVLPFADDVVEASKKFVLLLDCRHHYVTLTEGERRQYDETLATMTAFIRKKASLNPENRNSFGIFQAQLQLRLLCNHGTFQKLFAKDFQRDRQAEREEFLYSLGSNAGVTCSMCGIPIPVFDLLGGSNTYDHPCGHKLCQDCILQSQDDGVVRSGIFTAPCPLCKNMVRQFPCLNDQKPSRDPGIDAEGHFNEAGFSSKMTALMKDLEGNPSNAKRFVADSRYSILLMSTGVGAFGLNLTAASHVYILEPQWNPSVESQAIGRVSRLGQEKAVTVTRYIVRGTVEIQMHSQQIRKVELAKLGFQDDISISLHELQHKLPKGNFI
ncbi:hypothetical protein NM208_g940 [Fusarium decemcellulare]|uniref:Uncharacterized protein n=1 Tax=Fusarium decemcellulare TaxID=57161 RepID=A0ACC1SXL9_9HYPO|nr:hypothetical protein NM208_g940 [Fusarium decemcellulare]